MRGWLSAGPVVFTLGALVALGALGACASIFGIEAPIIDLVADASPAGDAAADAGREAATCGVTPDDSAAIFVEPTGVDGAGCGTRASACRTIQRGIDRAVALGKPTVHVARGDYGESLALHAGITVQGGWDILRNGASNDWNGVCGAAPSAAVVVAPATANVTVMATAIAGTATLSTLTIHAKDASKVQPGESLYGVFASDPSTVLKLTDVDVSIGDGGNGASPPAADGGTNAFGNCSPSDGGVGAPDGIPGAGADAGTITGAGYVAAAGGTGATGRLGENGAPPGAPTCASCVSCSGTVTCNTTQLGPSCGGPGNAGCAGGGGLGGASGGGGGSSIALFALTARVDVVRGSLRAGNGGQGAAGAAGGPGGRGSTGAPGGDTPPCPTACGNNGILSCGGLAPDAGRGAAGTPGGNGSRGGVGGGGAGGWSFAIVQGTTPVNVDPGTALVHGNYGASAGNGAPGRSGDRFP